MKTAVEWLRSQIVFESVDKELLARWDEDSDLSEYFEQALQMEKEQRGYSEEDVRLAYFQGEKDSYVKGGQTKKMEEEFIQSLKQKKHQQ
jgi:hypothetical protein